MRRLVPNLALALVSVALFLVCAEGAARLMMRGSVSTAALRNPPWLGERWLVARQDYRKRLETEGLLSRYLELYEWDRFLFYRLRPGRTLRMVDVMAPPELRERTRWDLRTNSRGFRTAEFAPRAAPGGVLRVAALGDSSTFGWGVEAEEAYPAQLARLLAARRPDAVEVLNLGVPGYSSFQGRVLLERVALPLAPTVITWSYLSNDGALTGEADADAYARRAGPLGALLSLLHRSAAFEALEGLMRVASTRLRPSPRLDPELPESRNVANYEEAASNVRAAVRAARAARVPIVLVANCIRPPPSDVLARVAREESVPFVDGTSLLDRAAERVRTAPAFARERKLLAARWGADLLEDAPLLHTFLPDGCHPNPVGHRILARAVANAVEHALAGVKP